MKKIYPEKLKRGDNIAVIAPSRSMSLLSDNTIEIANKRLEDMGLNVFFGQHVKEIDEFASSSVKNRISDLHWAFSDKSIKGILTVLGGFNSNQLLKYIDWNLIKNNPKIFCGYSDITALQNSIYAKTGLVTYSGPHYSSFGQLSNFEYTLEYFNKCLFFEEDFEVEPSAYWSDDAWYLNQQDCNLIKNEGYYTINEGEVSGTIIGANLVTLRTLQGTEFFPSLKNSVLFLESDYEADPHHIDRDLQSLILDPNFKEVKGIAFGRHQKNKISKDILYKIVKSKKELDNIPVIADLDFGHTSPMFTFPIGGAVYIEAVNANNKIVIMKH